MVSYSEIIVLSVGGENEVLVFGEIWYFFNASLIIQRILESICFKKKLNNKIIYLLPISIKFTASNQRLFCLFNS
jgi:hypothetical protein